MILMLLTVTENEGITREHVLLSSDFLPFLTGLEVLCIRGIRCLSFSSQ